MGGISDLENVKEPQNEVFIVELRVSPDEHCESEVSLSRLQNMSILRVTAIFLVKYDKSWSD